MEEAARTTAETAIAPQAGVGTGSSLSVQPASAPVSTGSAFDIHIEHVTKKFGRKLVLDDITLDIQGGELVALFGGSGSTTSTS